MTTHRPTDPTPPVNENDHVLGDLPIRLSDTPPTLRYDRAPDFPCGESSASRRREDDRSVPGRESDISRKTGYKIFARYQQCGAEGLTDRSRRPYRQANRLPELLESRIVQLRREHPNWGATFGSFASSVLDPNNRSSAEAVYSNRHLTCSHTGADARALAASHPDDPSETLRLSAIGPANLPTGMGLCILPPAAMLTIVTHKTERPLSGMC
jgi:hypothetical protein